MTAATADWLTKDFYAVLGVPQTAPAKEIARAYRRLARELHPDTRDGGDDDRFREVTAAYEVLSDEVKRKEYDELRAAAARRSAERAAGTGRGRTGSGRVRAHGFSGTGGLYVSDVFDGVSLEDLFADGFAGGFAGKPGRGRSRAERGQDLQATLHLGFEQAVRGTTADVTVDDTTPCHACRGTGTVSGSGACASCRGLGAQPRSRTVSARIPPGVSDGQTVRLPGRGGQGSSGGPPGDLLVHVSVARHPLFGRQDRNLTLTVPVTFPEATLGADITVPTLDSPVTVRIPPGTSSGTTLRVRGRGVPPSGRKGAGDLLVTVQVDVPKRLTPAQRAAVEQLAAATGTSPRAHLSV